jgi:uncharacterized protein YqgC (DUF456 family)
VSITEVVVGLVILVGLVGILVPVLPGSILVAIAVIVWATELGTGTAWVVAAVAVTLVAVGAVVKYAVPGRRLKQSGVPTSTLVMGGVGAAVGFVVVPVVGLLVGFVVGLYVAERRRVGAVAARPATVGALRAIGLGILIELVAATLAAATWVGGLLLT